MAFAAIEAVLPASNQYSQPRLRALIVDDSPTYLEVVCALVDREALVDVIGRATDGVDAIQAVSDLQPDVVIMDVDMPRMNGLTASLILSENFQGTKIILMSAEDSPEVRMACLQVGAAAFISKNRIREDIGATLALFSLENQQTSGFYPISVMR